ncbi:MAG: hypothetical protein D6730_07920 [Bacteroidetes bacterium]|nr:MAG: hypothetical protein D6730_07920 [Bacteroidota bacterium]
MAFVNRILPQTPHTRFFVFSFLLCTLFSLTPHALTAQSKVLITDDETYQDASKNALLELHAGQHDKGMLVPRMSSSQRLSIQPDSLADNGLLVYDLDSSSFWYWDGHNWTEVGRQELVMAEGLPFASVADYGAIPNDSLDDSAAIQAAIEANEGKSLFFPDGKYLGHIKIDKPVSLLSLSGQALIEGVEPGRAVLTVKANCSLKNLQFVHPAATPGSDGLLNTGYDIQATFCRFSGYEHDATHRSSASTFIHCNFYCNFESLGTLCWSPQAVFRSCTFNGLVGADVQDSKFYDCYFEGLWGVHMPEGTIDNFGNPSGFQGNAEFHNCVIKGTAYYAIGLGNAAHPSLYNCVVVGYTSGTYARTKSTYRVYNTYIEATKNNGGSSAVKFSKFPTAAQLAIGLEPEGESYFSNCKFVNSGSPNGYHLIVPARNDAGQAYFSNCTFDLERVCAEYPQTGCSHAYQDYLTLISTPSEQAVKSYVDANSRVISQKNIRNDGPLSPSIPPGYKITSIIIQEASGNQAGLLSIGTTEGGSEVVGPTELGAYSLLDCQLKQTIFSLSEAQTLYIHSAAWGGAEVEVYIKIEKVI